MVFQPDPVDFNTWHNPSQAFAEKHVLYPWLTTTLQKKRKFNFRIFYRDPGPVQGTSISVHSIIWVHIFHEFHKIADIPLMFDVMQGTFKRPGSPDFAFH